MTKITIDRATVEQALEWIEDAAVVLSHTSSAIQGGIGAEAEGVGSCSVKTINALRQALEQPNEFHPDWDQIKPFNDRIAELETVAKQALEAWEQARGALAYVAVGNAADNPNLARSTCSQAVFVLDKAETALRQALEQDVSLINEGNKEAQQQSAERMESSPVYHVHNSLLDDCEDKVNMNIYKGSSPSDDFVNLYVRSTDASVIDKSAAIRIATVLGWEPKREWVGLTDEEVDIVCEQIAADGPHHSIERFANAIEARLKEKNNG